MTIKTTPYYIYIIAAIMIIAAGCKTRNEKKATECSNIPVTECIVKTTPVKNQGASNLCWAYAMLATIESDRLMAGDSVNLSPFYPARKLIEEQAERLYLTQGKFGTGNGTVKISTRGMAPQLLRLIMKYGLTHYDAYHTDANINAVARKTENTTRIAIVRRHGLKRLRSNIADILDENIKAAPQHVYMLGAKYTPLEYAHSVCAEGDYVALTSYTHHPFGKEFALEVPDNSDGCMFLNVPVDTLAARVEHALRSGHAVCWEGDTSSPGFSFAQGIARLENEKTPVTQKMRQREFETFGTTDDHCMEIIGIARSKHGRKLFICKNSWGKGNPFGGFMYMTENYLRLNTIAIVMKRR